MSKYLLALVLGLLLTGSCKQKKNLESKEEVELNDFFEAYPKHKLPFTISDTNYKKLADTSTISMEVFSKFVPDSSFTEVFSKDRKLKINPIAQIEAGTERYLATLVSSKNKWAVYLDVFEKDSFSAHMPLLAYNTDKAVTTASIDKKLSIIINKEWGSETETMYERTILAYNNVGTFTTILTETNKPTTGDVAIINPIDTFPRLNKLSGDYSKGKNGFLSLRDAGKPNTYKFFVKFKNNDEEPCVGEIRGEIETVADKTAVYANTGDLCSIEFSFTGNQVKIKENGSCGNYRGITCFFNDTFARKKETKPASNKK